MSHHRNKLSSFFKILFCSAVILMLTSTQSSSARYLPTRADESDAQVLKNLIRGLVFESQKAPIMANPELLEETSGQRANPDKICFQPQPIHIQRRAAEVPHIYNGGDMKLD